MKFVQRTISLCIVLLLAFVAFSNASAQSVGKTVLVVVGLEPRSIGEEIIILAELKTEEGIPLAEQPLSLMIEGEFIEEELTDMKGQVFFRFEPDLPAGTYQMEVIYQGTPGFQPTQFFGELIFHPVELTVKVIPPLSGMSFSLDDRVFQSGEDGVARIMVEIPDVYRIQFQPEEHVGKPFSPEFKRWEPDFFDRSRTIYIPKSSHLVAGFELSFPVEIVYLDDQGQLIDPQRISSITMRSSQSAILTFEKNDPIWLKKNRIVRRLRGLDDVDLTYTVQSVIIDGSNVVNLGQQRFQVTPGIPWQVKVLLYSLDLSAKEAVFGFPIGNGVDLTYPDGHVRRILFEENHRATLDELARGMYFVRARSYFGLSINIPVVLSRNQQIELLVYSYPTLALLVILPVGFAFIMPILGRTRFRRFFREVFNTIRSSSNVGS